MSCAGVLSAWCSSAAVRLRTWRVISASIRGALRHWVRQAEADSGRRRELLTGDGRDELKRLREEVAELRRANAILKDAFVYFATELDPTRRR